MQTDPVLLVGGLPEAGEADQQGARWMPSSQWSGLQGYVGVTGHLGLCLSLPPGKPLESNLPPWYPALSPRADPHQAWPGPPWQWSSLSPWSLTGSVRLGWVRSNLCSCGRGGYAPQSPRWP